MIRKYVTPLIEVVVLEIEHLLCMSTGVLAPMEEKNDLEGLDWN
jgi:hypothetical protein